MEICVSVLDPSTGNSNCRQPGKVIVAIQATLGDASEFRFAEENCNKFGSVNGSLCIRHPFSTVLDPPYNNG
jgi:hypothetical protein